MISKIQLGKYSGLVYLIVLFGSLAEGDLTAREDYEVGFRPWSIAVGDFNGDGIEDIATANCGSNDFSVLLGNGDGTFQPQIRPLFTIGDCPTSIAVGDFDGDGREDLVTANFRSGDVSILLGNGDGTFRLFRRIGVDDRPFSEPVSVVVGDFNGDKIQDLAVANSYPESSNVAVLLGNGDGSFQRVGNLNVGPGLNPNAVAIGDFNRDGIQDLATANTWTDISVLIGNGDGSFRPPRNFRVGGFSYSVAVGDLNGDGFEDLAVVGLGRDVSIFLGNGDGSFQKARNYPVGGVSIQL